MSKKFLLDLPETEHQALKIAAATSGVSMHQFVRDAISEKIGRAQTAASLSSTHADTNETDGVAKANARNPPHRTE